MKEKTMERKSQRQRLRMRKEEKRKMLRKREEMGESALTKKTSIEVHLNANIAYKLR